MSECSICLSDILLKEAKTTICSHIFHNECLNQWLSTNNNCPLCRGVIEVLIPIPSITIPSTYIRYDSDNILRIIEGIGSLRYSN